MDIDQEDMCMHESGCENLATWFFESPEHWHDYIYCDEHKVEGCMPLFTTSALNRILYGTDKT